MQANNYGYSLEKMGAEFRKGIYTEDEIMGAIGNLSNHLLDLPLKNSLSPSKGVGSVTLTRAGDGSQVNRYGTLETKGTNVARFNEDGVYIEGSSTNLMQYSEDFSNGAWVKPYATISANTAETLDPYGTNLADKMTDTTDATSHSVYQGYSTTTDGDYTISFHVKKGTLSECAIIGSFIGDASKGVRFNFDTETITDMAEAGVLAPDSSGFERLSNGWYRVWIVYNPVNAITSVQARVALYSGPYSYTGSGTDYMYIFGAQLEESPFATSYISTVASPVTRALDFLEVPRDENMPAWDKPFTVMAKVKCNRYANGSSKIIMVNGVTPNGFLNINASGYAGFSVFGNTATDTTVLTDGDEYKIVGVSDGVIISLYVNGTLVATSTVGANTYAYDANLTIGSSSASTAHLNGRLSDFKIYDRALTPTEVALV